MALRGSNYTREHYRDARRNPNLDVTLAIVRTSLFSAVLYRVESGDRRFLEERKYISLDDDAMRKGRVWKWQLKSQRDPGISHQWRSLFMTRTLNFEKIYISFDPVLRRTKRWIDCRKRNLENYIAKELMNCFIRSSSRGDKVYDNIDDSDS